MDNTEIKISNCLLGQNAFYPAFTDNTQVLPLDMLKRKYVKNFKKHQVEFFQFKTNITSCPLTQPLNINSLKALTPLQLEGIPEYFEGVIDIPVHFALLSEEQFREINPDCNFKDYYGDDAEKETLIIVFNSNPDLQVYFDNYFFSERFQECRDAIFVRDEKSGECGLYTKDSLDFMDYLFTIHNALFREITDKEEYDKIRFSLTGIIREVLLEKYEEEAKDITETGEIKKLRDTYQETSKRMNKMGYKIWELTAGIETEFPETYVKKYIYIPVTL